MDLELRPITPGRPGVWRDAGEFHVMAPAAADEWDVHTWKEIGQGYSPEAAQAIGTREAQDLNYGPVTPGYKAGDILAFTGRARNTGTGAAAGVRLTGPGSAAFVAADLLPGEEALYFTPVCALTAQDVERGRLDVRYGVEWAAGGRSPAAGAQVRLQHGGRQCGRIRIRIGSRGLVSSSSTKSRPSAIGSP